MNFRSLYLALLLSIPVLSGCGSDQPLANANSSNSANTSGNIVLNVPAVDFNANVAPVSNANVATTDVPYPGVPADGKIKSTAVGAPDDSEFTMQLTDVGLETRTFKNHPQLIKVEKTITTKEQIVKVYLKDGRVIRIPTEKVSSMRMDAPATFLNAAGVKPAPSISAEDEKKLLDAKKNAKQQELEQKQ